LNQELNPAIKGKMAKFALTKSATVRTIRNCPKREMYICKISIYIV